MYLSLMHYVQTGILYAVYVPSRSKGSILRLSVSILSPVFAVFYSHYNYYIVVKQLHCTNDFVTLKRYSRKRKNQSGNARYRVSD